MATMMKSVFSLICAFLALFAHLVRSLLIERPSGRTVLTRNPKRPFTSHDAAIVEGSSSYEYPSHQRPPPLHRGTCRFFLDSADPKDWDELLPLGLFHGVTTNPTLLERPHQTCSISHLQKMAETVLSQHNVQEFMCQSWGPSVDDLYKRGMAISSMDRERVVIKVPVDKTGTQAAGALIASGVRVCLTACYDRKQALVAASCGAEYLAPYLGRMTDAGKDGLEECAKMQRIVDGLGSDTRILVASIRDVQSMTELAQAGLDTFTFSPDVARMLFDEPLTQKAAEDFEQAASRMAAVQ